MLKKIRALSYQHAIPAAFIIFLLIDFSLLGLGQLLSLLPPTLPMIYLFEIILMIVPAAFVFFFGFSSAFKKGSFLRGLLYGLPFIALQLFTLATFFTGTLGNPEVNWKPWYLIIYGVFSVFGIGFREECIYRATIQNVVAKKHANSVKGIWITVIIGAFIFGLTHVSNLFFGVEPLAVLTQAISSTFVGLLFGAIYLRCGNIWVLILIHTLTDIAGLSGSTFLNISDVEDISQLSSSLSWGWLLLRLAYVGFAIFLLRPSKCKQICENFYFADKESETATHT